MRTRTERMPTCEVQTAMDKVGIGAGGAAFYGLTLNNWGAMAPLPCTAMHFAPKYRWLMVKEGVV